MPLLAAFLGGAIARIFSFLAAAFGAQWGMRLTVMLAIAAGYVAFVGVFSAVVAPMFGTVFATQYGQLLGLLFPPAAGSVLAAMVGLWAAVLGYRYISSITRMAAG